MKNFQHTCRVCNDKENLLIPALKLSASIKELKMVLILETLRLSVWHCSIDLSVPVAEDKKGIRIANFLNV